MIIIQALLIAIAANLASGRVWSPHYMALLLSAYQRDRGGTDTGGPAPGPYGRSNH